MRAKKAKVIEEQLSSTEEKEFLIVLVDVKVDHMCCRDDGRA